MPRLDKIPKRLGHVAPPSEPGDVVQRPGFSMHLLPATVVSRALRRPLTAPLMVSGVGHFPRIVNHHCVRTTSIDDLILIACLHGRGWCRIAGRTWPVRAGHLVCVAPGQPHAYGTDPDDPWTISWLHLAGSHVRSWLTALDTSPAQPLRQLGDASAFLARFATILATVERGHEERELLAAAGAAWDLLAHLTTSATATPISDPLAVVEGHLRQHLDRAIPIATLARMASLSPSRFIARFRVRVGCSPMAFHSRLRLQRAAELLATTTQPIATVAELVGYSDAFHFSRRFSSAFGLSPTAWRNQRHAPPV